VGCNVYAEVCRSETLSALLELKNLPRGTEVMGMVHLSACLCVGGMCVRLELQKECKVPICPTLVTLMPLASKKF
jgi:hypothetical protein